MKVIGVLKSEQSYKRLRFQMQDSDIEWETYISDIDDLKAKLSVSTYDFAIVGESLWWSEEAIELFHRVNINILMFNGNYEDITNQLLALLPNTIEEVYEDVHKEDIAEQEEDDRQIRYIEKPVYINKEIEVKVPVYKQLYTNVPQQVISIVNLSKRAGSTFVTLNLAKAFSKEKIFTSVIEPPIVKPYIFDAISLDVKLLEDDEQEAFYSVPHEIIISSKVDRGQECIFDGISWSIPDPRKMEITDWNYEQMMKQIHASNASIKLIDIGESFEHPSIKPVLEQSDLILVIIDPLPVEILRNQERLKYFFALSELAPVEYIYNWWNKGVDSKDLLDALRLDPIIKIPALNTEAIYNCFYKGLLPIEHSELENELTRALNPLMKEIVPYELWDSSNRHERNTEKGGFFNKIKSALIKN